MKPGRLKVFLRTLGKIDFIIVFTITAMVLFGIYNIKIATQMNYGNHYFRNQLIFFGTGIIASIVIMLLGLNKILRIVPIFYWVTNILLVLVLTQEARGGAAGWFSLGPFSLQPAELAKVSVLLIVSKKMQDFKGRINDPKVFMIITGYALLPMVLMMLQPEMGLTMVCFFIVFFIYFVMGLKLRVFAGGLLLLGGGIFGALSTDIVPEHWKSRLYTFISGTTDELNVDYQLNTAKISIGSGQIYGSAAPGYYNWIPENYTDFIFAVISENFGFIGSVLLVLGYAVIMARLITTARKTDDIAARCITTGVFAILLFSVLQNIGMTIGLMPISGITLPFVSYGGSSLLTNMAAVALVLSIDLKRRRVMIG